jgi:hypothetical protein
MKHWAHHTSRQMLNNQGNKQTNYNKHVDDSDKVEQ